MIRDVFILLTPFAVDSNSTTIKYSYYIIFFLTFYFEKIKHEANIELNNHLHLFHCQTET